MHEYSYETFPVSFFFFSITILLWPSAL